MGTESSFRKKKNKSGELTKVSKQKSSETYDIKRVSNFMDNFKEENNKFKGRPPSKTVKCLSSNKNSSEESEYKSNINDLKSFSVQHLVKIDKNGNLDEAFGDSLETNFGSNKSKEEINNILNEELYNDLNDNNSFEEDEEENENNEEEKEKEEEEKKQKELILSKNIKTVFIDSKTNPKSHNESSSSEEGILSLTSTFDYELNFYRNGNEIRQSYLAKLLSSGVWTPNMKPKQHNSIIIFDWDDTLLPTTVLTPGGIFDEDMDLPEIDSEKLSKLEELTSKILAEAVEKGNVYIITNAGKGWVEYSAKRFYPSILPILSKIKIISARGEYEKAFPGNSRQWKIEAFLNLQKSVNMKLVTNIICIGDSLFEMEAGRILASRFTEAFVKTIKFREAPKLDELIKQLKLVSLQFSSIYSSIKNLTIRVEKKKKVEI